MSSSHSEDVSGRLVTIAEAARELGISREAVRKRIFRSTLPANKVDGQWWIRIDEFWETVGRDYDTSRPVDVKFAVTDEEPQEASSRAVRVDESSRVSGVDVDYRRLGEELLAPAMREFSEQVSQLQRRILELEAEQARLEQALARHNDEEDAPERAVEAGRPWWKFW